MIRVLRVMEYEYDTLEQANADMARWQVPAVGSKKFGPKAALIKSTVLLPHYEMAKQHVDVALVEAVQPEDFIGKAMTVTVANETRKVVD